MFQISNKVMRIVILHDIKEPIKSNNHLGFVLDTYLADKS